MKSKVANANPKNLNQLKIEIKKAWDEIRPETLVKLSDSMPGRLTSVLEKRGNAIGK